MSQLRELLTQRVLRSEGHERCLRVEEEGAPAGDGGTSTVGGCVLSDTGGGAKP